MTTRHLLTITVKEFLFGPSVAALPVNPELPSVGHWSRSGSGVANAFFVTHYFDQAIIPPTLLRSILLSSI